MPLIAGARHRSAGIGKGRQGEGLLRQKLSQRLEARCLSRSAARQDLEFAPAHEAAAGDRPAEDIGIGHRVALGIELGDAGVGIEANDPGASRQQREMLPAAGQITQIVAARIMDAGEHLAPAAEMVLAELAF